MSGVTPANRHQDFPPNIVRTPPVCQTGLPANPLKTATMISRIEPYQPPLFYIAQRRHYAQLAPPVG